MFGKLFIKRFVPSAKTRSEREAMARLDRESFHTDDVRRCRDQCRSLWRASSYRAAAALAVGFFEFTLRELRLYRELRVLSW